MHQSHDLVCKPCSLTVLILWMPRGNYGELKNTSKYNNEAVINSSIAEILVRRKLLHLKRFNGSFCREFPRIAIKISQ